MGCSVMKGLEDPIKVKKKKKYRALKLKFVLFIG